jgi:RNA polymerase sigma factor (sigma-70 family)
MVEVPRVAVPTKSESLDLQTWMNAHGNRLLRSACLLCGDKTEAQDLVQETFVQALKSVHRFRGDSAIYTWLHGILLNLCRRHLRKQRRLVFEEERLLKEPAQADSASGLDKEFCTTGLTAALQKLSPEHREVIVLRYYENMKISEIACHAGISKGTVKSRLHYAVRSLEQFVPKEMNLFGCSDTHHLGTVFVCLLLLISGIHYLHKPKAITEDNRMTYVIDVPLQSETHVSCQQGNMVIDTVVRGSSLVNAREIN